MIVLSQVMNIFLDHRYSYFVFHNFFSKYKVIYFHGKYKNKKTKITFNCGRDLITFNNWVFSSYIYSPIYILGVYNTNLHISFYTIFSPLYIEYYPMTLNVLIT